MGCGNSEDAKDLGSRKVSLKEDDKSDNSDNPQPEKYDNVFSERVEEESINKTLDKPITKLTDREGLKETQREEHQEEQTYNLTCNIVKDQTNKDRTTKLNVKQPEPKIVTEDNKTPYIECNTNKDPKEVLMALGYDLQADCDDDYDNKKQNSVRQLVIPYNIEGLCKESSTNEDNLSCKI